MSSDEDAPQRPAIPPLLPALVLAGVVLAFLAYNSYMGGMPFGSSEPYRSRATVMGTEGHVVLVPATGIRSDPDAAAAAAFEAMRRVESQMSRFREGSDVSRFNAASAGEAVEVSPETWRVVLESLRLNRLSDGAFDITITPLLGLYDYKSGRMTALPSDDALAGRKALVGGDKVLFDREGMRLAPAATGVQIDLGAIAKGFAVDEAARALEERGFQNYVVELGGEVRLRGRVPMDEQPNARQEVGQSNASKGETPADETSASGTRPWRTGIQNPRDPLRLARVLDLTNCAVATSGDYEKYFEIDGRRYSHIVDPRTGLPVSGGVVSATVIHFGPGADEMPAQVRRPRESCMLADGLATTFSVLGEEGTSRFLERYIDDFRLRGLRVILYVLQEDGSLREVEFRVPDEGPVERVTTAEKAE